MFMLFDAIFLAPFFIILSDLIKIVKFAIQTYILLAVKCKKNNIQSLS